VSAAAVRMSADERRRQVLKAALSEFARGGFAGTSTETIAARAGISQPYLFRLFPTKKALFIACIESCFGRVEQCFVEASEGLTGKDALDAMALAYGDLVTDRELLLSQHHSYAACGDPEIRTAVRDCFGRLWGAVAARSACSIEELQLFFAMGMLWNVAAAMDLVDLPETWAQSLLPDNCRIT
jgi:AcrR family transcriptional regulator